MGELFPRAMIESVRPEFLLEFLEPFRTYCESRGLSLDLELAKRDEDAFVERVYQFFNEADAARPAGLIAATDAIVHVAEDDGHDHVHAALGAGGAMPSIPPRLTQTELALWTYERFPDAFASAARRKQRVSKQSLWEFLPSDSRPLVDATSAERQAALNDRLRQRHGQLGHTRYADVRVSESAHEIRIFWFHGRPAQTQGIIQRNEERELQRVVRERCDVTLVDRLTGRLAVSAINPSQISFLRDTLGEVFFGNADHYNRRDIYTGERLLDQGKRALSVQGIPALRRVELRAITLWFDQRGRENYESDTCLFDTNPRRMIEAKATPETLVLKMKLAVLYASRNHERTIEISIPNHILVDRRVAEGSLREFLVLRGFARYADGYVRSRAA